MTQEKLPTRREAYVLKRIWRNPLHPASFSGITNLYYAAKKEDLRKINVAKVKNFLATEKAYTLHKPIRKTFKHDKVMVYGPSELWEADLAHMNALSKRNNKFAYLLCLVDTYRKKLFVRAIKDKTGIEVASGLREIFQHEKKPPVNLRTDNGRVRKDAKTEDIDLYIFIIVIHKLCLPIVLRNF